MDLTTAPWWGVPTIAGTFLLVGGLIGALVSFFSVRASDRRKAAREDEQRWHELVRTLSAGVFASAANIKELARENSELYEEGYDDTVPTKARVSSALWNEQNAILEKASEISIIVPQSFTRALSDYVFDVTASVDTDDKTAAIDALRNLPKSRGVLMGEVRKYLGLPGDTIRHNSAL
jgi:hypothetical protein